MSYKPPKATYILTPQRKKLGKAVARRSHQSIAIECLRNKNSCSHAMIILCSMIYKEIKSFSSNKAQSTLEYQSQKSIYNWEWETVHMECSSHAPLLLRILTAATRTKLERRNQTMVIVMCFAMIVKLRNPSLNILQKIISLIPYSGHSSKQVCLCLYIIHKLYYCVMCEQGI